MSSQESVTSSITVAAENIGGIDSTEVTLAPGVNVLTGRNATNRTSFLQTIMAALGSRRSSLKGDADDGRVELTFDDERYMRSLTRRNGEVVFDGDPYLDEPELADLFAFLLESNEARRAVRSGDDLREIIMRPIDTDEIEAEIDRLEAEKRDLDGRLEELAQLDSELPDLESDRVALADEIEATEERIADLEADLEEFDLDVEASRERKDAIESAFADLQEARTELESIEYDLETERESRAELETERDDLETELEAFDDDPESPDRLEGRVQELRDRKRSLDTTVSELQSVIRFNEERLAEDGFDVDLEVDDGAAADDDGDVTDQLLADSDDVVCWTCGSRVDRDRIEATLDRLRSLRQRKLDERSDLQEQIDDLSDRRKELREQRQKRGEIETRLEAVEDELERRTDRIEALEADLEEQRARVEDLESDAETYENAEYGEVIDTHRDLNRLELELEDLEAERDEVEARIAEIEEKIEERSDLEQRRETVEDELTDLRTRVDRIEENAVDAFNDHMDSILSILEYRNIDRIWIERRERTVREGRRKVSRTAFDLHIVRTTEDGRTYEDTVDHLSESEREVTGLVFALAGYLVHDVYEIVPFMLLDSLEAIDSNRIADLVAYFEEYVDCLVVALLREDAEALSESYTYVEEI
ncbi:AAA family ATPase [Natrinema thermotolerans]|uniref:AAA family ATPase n=1 Tax=Natrinema thermotolerans TaxID=121872 RepID=A0AAF0PDB1_9EURY|nr:archaea-specific SMC-related protein [Natrinema thermotolerans]QCC60333.1 chromosome segregation protein SMC [Natrinema thermotolerans]QCC61242.1 chromosome segregation protein SMC [Natrinema thermotolerans]WMT07359.1 AAA family ATPase [Natrinema thermotolerans]